MFTYPLKEYLHCAEVLGVELNIAPVLRELTVLLTVSRQWIFFFLSVISTTQLKTTLILAKEYNTLEYYLPQFTPRLKFR